MAIFAGNWKDALGKPFDPGAKVPDTWADGGSAATRRLATRPNQARAQFIATARAAAHRWLNTIPSPDQDAWETQGQTGASERGTLDRTPVNGFVQYASFDFVQLYHQPPSVVLAPTAAGENFLSAVITDADFLTQTVTFIVDADPDLHLFAWARLATYQINPKKIHGANPWRHTRLIDLAPPAAFDPPPYQTTVPLLWHVKPGDTVLLYWRGRLANWWKFEAHDHRIVT